MRGLEATWGVIAGLLMRGSPDDALGEEDGVAAQTVWGLLDHDLPHAGELSLLLGAAGWGGVDL